MKAKANLTAAYFAKYPQTPFTEVPAHLIYNIHAGSRMSTDVDVAAYMAVLQGNFFGGEDGRGLLHLDSYPPGGLKELLTIVHTNLLSAGDARYREQFVTVCRGSNRDPIPVLIEKQRRQVPAELTAKRLAVDQRFKQIARTFVDEEAAIFLTRTTSFLEMKLTDLRARPEDFKKYHEAVVQYISENKNQFVLANGSLVNFDKLNLSDARIFEELVRSSRHCIQLLFSFFDLEKEIYPVAGNLRQIPELIPRYQAENRIFERTIANLTAEEQEIYMGVIRQEGHFVPTFPDKIEQEMQAFSETWHQKLREDDPIRTAAWFMMEYCRIHPFQNANGRDSRFWAFNMFLAHHILPPIFDNDAELMKVYREANDDHDKMADYLFEKICVAAELYFKQPELYQQQFPKLSEQKLELLSTVCKAAQANLPRGAEHQNFDPANSLDMALLIRRAGVSTQSLQLGFLQREVASNEAALESDKSLVNKAAGK